MKKTIKQQSFLLILIMLLFSSCSKTNSMSTAPVSAILSSGNWQVSLFRETGSDHTASFAGFTFAFTGTGAITALKSGVSTNGTWDNDESMNEFHMDLGNTDPLKDLGKGWTVSSKTENEIIFTDDNVSHNEELHFRKI